MQGVLHPDTLRLLCQTNPTTATNWLQAQRDPAAHEAEMVIGRASKLQSNARRIEQIALPAVRADGREYKHKRVAASNLATVSVVPPSLFADQPSWTVCLWCHHCFE